MTMDTLLLLALAATALSLIWAVMRANELYDMVAQLQESLAAIADGKAYLNVHSSTFPGGEIRGFFVLAPVPEIDPATGSSALSLVAGVLAMIEQRRRRATLVA